MNLDLYRDSSVAAVRPEQLTHRWVIRVSSLARCSKRSYESREGGKDELKVISVGAFKLNFPSPSTRELSRRIRLELTIGKALCM